ncbi:MAG: hypothetical protein EXS36_18650 [Pedosphaera sp.]|nr:hypothetical protein [Pedosphaera sp.]
MSRKGCLRHLARDTQCSYTVMKTETLRSLSWLLIAGLYSLLPLRGQTTLALWTFNDTNSPQATPAAGFGSLAAVGGTHLEVASGSPADINATSNHSLGVAGFPAAGKAPGTAGIELHFSPARLAHLHLGLDWYATGSASRRLRVDAAEAGLNFTTVGSLVIGREGSFTNDLCFDLSDLAESPTGGDIVVRIVSDFDSSTNYVAAKPDGKYSTSGKWRFDRIVVTGWPPDWKPEPPVFTIPPVGQTNRPGTTALLQAEVHGQAPFWFQWRHDGTNLLGANQNQLKLSRVKVSQAGLYDLMVTNIAGAITSSPVRLSVTSAPTNAVLSVIVIPASIVSASDTKALELNFEIPPGRTCSIWSTDTLSDPFQRIATSIPFSPYSDTNLHAACRFYRVTVP